MRLALGHFGLVRPSGWSRSTWSYRVAIAGEPHGAGGDVLGVVDQELCQGFRAPARGAAQAVDEGVEAVEFAGIDQVAGQPLLNGPQGLEQRGIDAERQLLRGAAARVLEIEQEMVGDVVQIVAQGCRRRRTPEGEAAQRDALAGDEALGRLFVQPVADPQAQLVAHAVEVVRDVAAVDRLDQVAPIFGVMGVGLQHPVEPGVGSVVEREDALFAAVDMFEIEAALAGCEPGPVAFSVVAGGSCDGG